MALINCPNCGASISDKAHRCPKCGYILRSSDRSNSPTETTNYIHSNITPTDIPQYEQESPRRSYYWLLYVGGCVILIGLALWLFSSKNASSTQINSINEETPILVATEEMMACKVDTVVPSEIAVEEEVKADRCGKYTLKGKVNDKYDIQIWLSFEGSTMSGKYCYTTTLERYGDQPSSYIEFHGEIDYNNFTFTATSPNSSNKTEWTGTFDDNRFYAKKTGTEEEMVAYVEY